MLWSKLLYKGIINIKCEYLRRLLNLPKKLIIICLFTIELQEGIMNAMQTIGKIICVKGKGFIIFHDFYDSDNMHFTINIGTITSDGRFR